MPNLVQELNSLDFSVYIGGPMQAAVQAQHAASMSQVSFIQAVGFEDINGTCFVKGRNEKRFSIQPYHACVETEPDELIAILEPVPEEEAPAAFRKPIPETGDDVW